MIAEIIIDIKTTYQGINKPFDYLVPPHFEKIIKKAMRVVVPFGNANSQRLGYIINLKENSKFNKNLKEIITILDETPYFDQEFFLLSQEMLKTPFIIKALVYETIFPKEFVKSFLKEIKIINKELFPENLKGFFANKKELFLNPKNKSQEKLLEHFTKLSKKKIVIIKDILQLKEKNTEKKICIYHLNPQLSEQKDIKLTPKQKDFIAKLKELKQLKPLKPLKMLDKTSSNEIKHSKPKIKTQEITRKKALELTSNSIIQSLIRKKILLQTEQKISIVLNHNFDLLAEDKKIILNEEQQQIAQKINLNYHKTYLLYGKTGSGKTEIYLHLITKVLNQNKQVLLLVPEVMLIAPLMQRLQAKFTNKNIAILHSYLSPKEHLDQFLKIKEQQACIVLGTRSAIFAPLNNLGIVIIDEEHDEALIEKERATYDARTLAQIRAKYHKIPLILGSATPSLESHYQVLQQNYQLLSLTKRALIDALPTIELVDMKEELKKGNLEPFSQTLKHALREVLAKQQQAILFINTKGFAPFVLCRFCGFVPKCHKCNNSLTFYQKQELLKCSHCNYKDQFTPKCMRCSKEQIKEVGVGIEYIEAYLQKEFLQARLIKFDSDTITKISQYEKLWNDFNQEKADILLGTQMIAKGLDFHKVTLVGILMADSLLKIPSFKGSEKTFQLLIQAAGRCGRKEQGKVIVQSYNIDHFAINAAVKYEEKEFLRQLLEERKISQNPPFGYLSQILISHKDFKKTFDIAYRIKAVLANRFSHKITVLGPVLSLIPKKNNRYRCLLTLKYSIWPLDLDFILENNIHQDALIIFDRFANLL
ncbi:replication restart helicase PriA [Candidatus Phytoplasma asteris]|uniref:Replication restart protein PriA n=2 Tax=16SrI (Aster yellows group) TaxID=3042590 RepID=A0A859I945_9MOLU|nr:MAG: primosomal protein N' (replication factor Y) (superfamily II helicase) [Rapeseed phyllody phytoplasma]